MPALLEVQRTMRAQLFADGNDELLAIYRHTVLTALVNALRLSYPVVQRLVGAEFFEGVARQFIREHTPRGAYLNDYGADFAQFLAQFPAAAGIVYLGEIAQLEWSVNRALHAVDAPRLDVARLSALSQEQLPMVRFVPHPGLSLLQLQSPCDAIWRAVLDQDDAAMAAIDLNSGPVYLLIERNDDGLQVRRLPQMLWRFTATLSGGRPLFEAIGEADPQQLDEINTLLAQHLASGRFIDFKTTGDLRA